MSHPSRPKARGPSRQKREVRLEVQHLEIREVLTPVLATFPTSATFTANAGTPSVGNVTITTQTTGTSTFASAAPFTSVSQLTPINQFGGDIVRIEAGPGGDFGKGIYAVSRGAGSNTGAINRPGVIYRVDPATGKASVFFDLNTVIPQLNPSATSAANSAGTGTGLVNWYDVTFDPEGYFDGRSSMFVSTVDSTDPTKNAIYRIGPDGSFLGAFVTYSDSSLKGTRLSINPSAILVPPAEQQSFLRGLISGTGTGSSTVQNTTSNTQFAALFFDANQYKPGQNISTPTLPPGVKNTALTLGPQVGLASTSTNTDYVSQVYSAFTDFGVPAFPPDSGNPFPQTAGFSGVQGLGGGLLIGTGTTSTVASTGTQPTGFTLGTGGSVDGFTVADTNLRRFQDTAFDKYGYFSNGVVVTSASTTTTGTTGTTTNFTYGAVQYVGSLFVSDLASGLATTVPTPGTTTGQVTVIPVQGPGGAGATLDSAGNQIISASSGSLGGRIVRISPTGVVTPFATGFNTSNAFDSSSFTSSSLSITFSADGTTLYAADNDGIWQFKTQASLAGSTSGSLVGLNDLRTLGVPYEGQNSAVTILDTGVDATSPGFRGRVAPGKNVLTNGTGNDDYAAGLATTAATGNGNNGNNGTTGGASIPTTADGHGTLVAGVVSQFVPQATLNPVSAFNPFNAGNTGGTTGGGGGNGNGGGTTTIVTNTLTSTNAVYNGFAYTAAHPYVADPVRPGQTDRVIAATIGFGTSETFDSEGTAFRRYPQIVIAFKNQFKKFRDLGIAPIAAAGQFGAPLNTGGGGNGGNGGNGGGTGTSNTGFTNSNQSANVGDVNGMSLPAILNEVISVTGVYPFPYLGQPDSIPTDPANTLIPRVQGPVLVFGGTSSPGGTTTTTGNTGTTNASVQPNSLGTLTAAEGGGTTTGGGNGGGNGNNGGASANTGAGVFYSDRVLGAANRSVTTDFAAPALDVPTFRRRFVGDASLTMTYTAGGTSLSAGIVTGSYAVVSSALQYWTNQLTTASTADAYLTQPVGVKTLNFGTNAFANLTPYNTPDGINGILAYTAVAATDVNDGQSQSGPFRLKGDSTQFRSYARVDVGNAVASIEGTVALQYLFAHNAFDIIDTNHNGLITAQEIQTFVDDSARLGLPEDGAMARLLGGTARAATNDQNGFTSTGLTGDTPEQPDALQRRFNYFDYAADGDLNGAVSIDSLKMLSTKLLPQPDQYVVVDRQRASANGYLLAPDTKRNFNDLKYLKPTYMFVPKSKVQGYAKRTPASFGVNKGLQPNTTNGPVYSLFSAPVKATKTAKKTTVAKKTTPVIVTPTTTTPTTTTTASTTTTGDGNTAQSIVDSLKSLASQNSAKKTSNG